MLETTDSNSNTTFNNLTQKMINNDVYLKENVTKLQEKDVSLTNEVNTLKRNYTYVGNVFIANNLASYYPGRTENTGTIKIKVPEYNFMFSMRVNLRGYNACLNYTIGGYTYNTDNGTHPWHMGQAGVTGYNYMTIDKIGVRFAVNKSKPTERYILIGTTTTQWSGYLHVLIPELIVGYGGTSGLASGWEISLVTSEADLTIQGIPELNKNI